MADIDKDEENYLRAVLLLLKGCKYIILEVLCQAAEDKKEQTGKDIHTVLQEAQTQLREILYREQREKLFPGDGSKTQTVTWDISLITLVIRKCYNSSLTQQEDNAVKTIRRRRNEVLGHSSDASLTRGDYDDVCRELKNAINILARRFDESVRQTCNELVQKSLNGKLQTAKDDLKTIQDSDNLCKVLRKKIEELEKKNRELLTQIKRMFEEEKNGVFKTVQVVDTEIEISAPRSDGYAVNMAERILTTVMDQARRRVGSDAAVNEIRMAVDDILNEIEKCGMTVFSVEQRCIILRIKCTSFYQILQLLGFIEDAKFQSRLNKLADALTGLKTDLQHPLELAFRISKKSVDSLLACLRDEDAEAKRKISLSVQCPSVEGLDSFWNFIEEGKGASRVDRLSKALSKHLGKNISITLSLNQEQVLQTLQNAEFLSCEKGAQRQLLPFAELREYFCHSLMYGCAYLPGKTIIYYKVVREAPENSQAQLQQPNIQRQNAEWSRLETDHNNRTHAEEILIDKLNARGQITGLGNGDYLEISMVMSYSPCNSCSELLLKFKRDIEIKGVHVTIKIKVANFYKYPTETRKLRELVQENGFEFSIFRGLDDWRSFYKDVNGIGIAEMAIGMRDLYEARIKREEEDTRILAEIAVKPEKRKLKET